MIKTHICLITDYCPDGELFLLLDRQPMKVLKEDVVRFYAAEVVVALEVGNGGMSPEEDRSHFSIWALMKMIAFCKD
ncbi:hypothetical protein F0562_011402 [Nyssa sinensis]|uniref:non-specific serine/threonine protein kinase n=1 Tax=Nyssa sinensis TaxID=561372 RepID=A0A5J5A3F2_9ASTE|nr:hypothetical protein F0562_011402 [Nyssa sinensis]